MNNSENVNFDKPGSKNGYRIVKREQEQKLIEKHRKEIESLRLQWEEHFKEELYKKDTQIAQLQNEIELKTSELGKMEQMNRHVARHKILRMKDSIPMMVIE